MVSEFGSNRLTGLSVLEVALVMENLLEQLQGTPPEKKIEINEVYRTTVEDARNISTRGEIIENPGVILVRREGNLSAYTHPTVEERELALIEELTDLQYKSPFQEKAIQRFIGEYTWNRAQEREITVKAAARQSRFLTTGSAHDLKDVKQSIITTKTKLTPTTLAQLTKNLSTELPNGNVVMTRVLMPGGRMNQIISAYVMTKLQTCPLYSQEGELDLTYISKLLRKEYGVEITPCILNSFRKQVPICN
jgi:hypothetical protein